MSVPIVYQRCLMASLPLHVLFPLLVISGDAIFILSVVELRPHCKNVCQYRSGLCVYSRYTTSISVFVTQQPATEYRIRFQTTRSVPDSSNASVPCSMCLSNMPRSYWCLRSDCGACFRQFPCGHVNTFTKQLAAVATVI